MKLANAVKKAKDLIAVGTVTKSGGAVEIHRKTGFDTRYTAWGFLHPDTPDKLLDGDDKLLPILVSDFDANFRVHY